MHTYNIILHHISYHIIVYHSAGWGAGVAPPLHTEVAALLAALPRRAA